MNARRVLHVHVGQTLCDVMQPLQDLIQRNRFRAVIVAHGGRDNVSIIVVPSRVSWTGSLASRWRGLGRSALVWLAAVAGAVLAVLVVYLAKHFGLLS